MATNRKSVDTGRRGRSLLNLRLSAGEYEAVLMLVAREQLQSGRRVSVRQFVESLVRAEHARWTAGRSRLPIERTVPPIARKAADPGQKHFGFAADPEVFRMLEDLALEKSGGVGRAYASAGDIVRELVSVAYLEAKGGAYGEAFK